MDSWLYLKIVGEDKCTYGIYLLNKNEIIKYIKQNRFKLHLCNATLKKPTKTKVRLSVDGILLHYILKEFLCSPCYRNTFVARFYSETNNINSILFKLVPVNKNIIDYNWNYRISYSVRERCELEHALSWLSTLGGAFSALGDYFSNFAKVAGKISYRQLVLAVRMDDPSVQSRCKLYFSLSLIQQHDFKTARKIISKEYAAAKNAVVGDSRLVKMCLGIWSKLQYEHKVFRDIKKCRKQKIT